MLPWCASSPPAHLLRGRGCEGHDGHTRQQALQAAQLPVGRAEVMTPAADAVCLIDGHQLQPPRLTQLLHGTGKAAGQAVKGACR
jgi:hypothetical protein